MSTPRHQRPTFSEPARGRSTSDPPIYLALVRDLYGDDALGPMAEWDLRVLQEVLDGLRALGTDRATPDRQVASTAGSPWTVSGQLSVGAPDVLPELPRREPGAQLPPGVRPIRSDTRAVPPMPETRQPDREPFIWLPPQAVVAGGR